MQRTVSLSTTEAESAAAVTCAQDMLYVMKVLESVGLMVEKPLVLQIDNKGAEDLANYWILGGQTHHVDV